ncbi:hypothetical protein NMY22_g6905 [Coprinellus aureogranulatus]|nr:hypothetical protein NMY22_g6905 [Coprinellus aureogranulatus]
MIPGRNELKRSCSSLTPGNVCNACQRLFDTPHALSKHQKHRCPETTRQLAELRKGLEEIEHRSKRRRIDATPLDASPSCLTKANSSLEDNLHREGALNDTRGAAAVSSSPQITCFGSGPARVTDSTRLSDLRISDNGKAIIVKCNPDQNSDFIYASGGSEHSPGSTDLPSHPVGNGAGSPNGGPREASNLHLEHAGHAENTSPSHPPIAPTLFNSFRLRRRYDRDEIPENDPDAAITSLDRYDSTNHIEDLGDEEEDIPNTENPKEDHVREVKDSAAARKAEIGEIPGCGERVTGDTSGFYEGGKLEEAGKREEEEIAKIKEWRRREAEAHDAELLAPFPNVSSFQLGDWFYNQGNQKSLKDFKALIRILKSPAFSVDDIKKTPWTAIFRELGKNKEDMSAKKGEWVDDSGWKTTEVAIEVPVHNRMAQGRGVERNVAGTLHHRSITSILEEKIRNQIASQIFHFDGHELLWKPGEAEGSPEFRILSELYNSDAFLEAQNEVRHNPPPEIGNCELPRVVVGLMYWSDATHLSTFSTSKLWPLYMVFGNESKYRRGAGTSDTCNHVAYFDSISDDFKDYLTERTGGRIPPNLMAHLNRELFHEQWAILLDDDLLKAIVEGIIIRCSDGVERRFFIRIFTYSSDYPERCPDTDRVLIATIKCRGDCPCVRCLVRKKDLSQTGTQEDTSFRSVHPRVDSLECQERVINARKVIGKGKAVNGDPVQRLLQHSQVPTINAFSKRLLGTGFDIFSALVVDILHEYEIGVFKSLFLHLIRVLEASAPGSVLVHKLDKRYRSVPTFNQTIRRFSSNVSELKRRAARDYEDLLQCAIPSFHGLLPGSLDAVVSRLLYVNARWHALAKLRMHSQATICLLEDATAQLGDHFRAFLGATSTVNTVETQREAEKRNRSTKKKANPKTRKRAAKNEPSSQPNTTFRVVHTLPANSDSPVMPSNVAQRTHPLDSGMTQVMEEALNSGSTPGAELPSTSQASGRTQSPSHANPLASAAASAMAAPTSGARTTRGRKSKNQSKGSLESHIDRATQSHRLLLLCRFL